MKQEKLVLSNRYPKFIQTLSQNTPEEVKTAEMKNCL
jgi:hypothetical protein